jgi:hypothetical protein
MPSLTNPQAFNRRLDIKCKVDIKNQFAKQIQIASNAHKVLDVDKVRSITGHDISTAPYVFEQANSSMNYDQFLVHAKQKLDAKMEHSNNLRNWVSGAAAQMDEDTPNSTDEEEDVYSDTETELSSPDLSESDQVMIQDQLLDTMISIAQRLTEQNDRNTPLDARLYEEHNRAVSARTQRIERRGLANAASVASPVSRIDFNRWVRHMTTTNGHAHIADNNAALYPQDFAVANAMLNVLPTILARRHAMQDCIIHAIGNDDNISPHQLEAFARLYHLSTVLRHGFSVDLSDYDEEEEPDRTPPEFLAEAIDWTWEPLCSGGMRRVALNFAIDTAHIQDMLSIIVYLTTTYSLACGMLAAARNTQHLGPPVQLISDEGTTTYNSDFRRAMVLRWESLNEAPSGPWYRRMLHNVRNFSLRGLVSYSAWRNRAQDATQWLTSSRFFTIPASITEHAIHRFCRALNIITTARHSTYWSILTGFISAISLFFGLKACSNFLFRHATCHLKRVQEGEKFDKLLFCRSGCVACATFKTREHCGVKCRECIRAGNGMSKSNFDEIHVRTIIGECLFPQKSTAEGIFFTERCNLLTMVAKDLLPTGGLVLCEDGKCQYCDVARDMMEDCSKKDCSPCELTLKGCLTTSAGHISRIMKAAVEAINSVEKQKTMIAKAHICCVHCDTIDGQKIHEICIDCHPIGQTGIQGTLKKTVLTTLRATNLALTESEEVRTRRSRRPRAEENVIAEALTDTNADQVIHSKVAGNTFVVSSEVISNQQVCMRAGLGIFVKGRILLMVKHVYESLGDIVTLTCLKNNTLTYDFPKSELLAVDILTPDNEPKDLVLVSFPRTMMTMPDIHKHFIQAKDQTKYETFKVTLLTHRDKVLTRLESYAKPEHHLDEFRYLNKDQEIWIRDYYQYTAETKPGDCGAPLVAHAPSLTGKLIGIHVAGAVAPGTAYSTSITYELLKIGLDKFPIQAQVCWNVTTEDVVTPIEGQFYPLATTTPLGSPSGTKLRPSSIHGHVSVPTTMPSALKPMKVQGIPVDPMLLALAKNAGKTPLIDQELLHECVKAVLPSVSQKWSGPMLYTIHEAALGIDGDDRVRCLDRQSSAGYPWVLYAKKPGKQDWLGKDDDKYVAESMLQAVQFREKEALQGRRVLTVWVDTLKDERRPIEKVMTGKTRSFACGPVDYNILFRRHFLAFVANAMDNRIHNEISVGTDPYSFDWEKTFVKLTHFGKNLTSGDFSNFDGSLSADLLWSVFDVINNWYLLNGETQHEIVRYVLWLDIVNSVHLLHDTLYVWAHSQPSGNAATTIINCLAVKLATRYAFSKETNLPPQCFEDYCSMVCYGDDVNINVRPGTNLDSFALQRGYSQVGLTYTDAEKTGNLQPYVNIDDIQYLKRRFRYEPYLGRHVAPLNLNVVLEMCNWVRGDDIARATIDNVQTAIRELALHDEETFQYVDKLSSAVYHQLGRLPQTFTRKALLDCYKTGYFKLQWGDSTVDKSFLRM